MCRKIDFMTLKKLIDVDTESMHETSPKKTKQETFLVYLVRFQGRDVRSSNLSKGKRNTSCPPSQRTLITL